MRTKVLSSSSRRHEIVLIGPCGSGKSTTGRLLAAQLGLPGVSMDDLCQRYYADAPKPQTSRADSSTNSKYPKGWIQGRWKDLYALERLFGEHSNCVFDLGAGHSIYEVPEQVRRAQELFLPFDNVVLLMPSPNHEEAIQTLRERTLRVKDWDCVVDGFDFHEHFVRHHCNFDFAKFRVVTHGKSPEQTRNEIIALVGLRREAIAKQ